MITAPALPRLVGRDPELLRVLARGGAADDQDLPASLTALVCGEIARSGRPPGPRCSVPPWPAIRSISTWPRRRPTRTSRRCWPRWTPWPPLKTSKPRTRSIKTTIKVCR